MQKERNFWNYDSWESLPTEYTTANNGSTKLRENQVRTCCYPACLGELMEIGKLHTPGAAKSKDNSLDEHSGLRHTQDLTGMIDECLLMYEASLWRLEKRTVLSNAQTPTQRIKENDETGYYVPNKIR